MQRNYSRTRCADAGLGWGWVHESARGWDIDCVNGVGLGNLFKNSVGWDGVGNCAGTGGDGENLVTPCRPLACIAHVSTMAPQELSTNAWKGTMAT